MGDELLGGTWPKPDADLLLRLHQEFEALRDLLLQKGIINRDELLREVRRIRSQTREVEQ